MDNCLVPFVNGSFPWRSGYLWDQVPVWVIAPATAFLRSALVCGVILALVCGVILALVCGVICGVNSIPLLFLRRKFGSAPRKFGSGNGVIAVLVFHLGGVFYGRHSHKHSSTYIHTQDERRKFGSGIIFVAA